MPWKKFQYKRISQKIDHKRHVSELDSATRLPFIFSEVYFWTIRFLLFSVDVNFIPFYLR